MAHPLPPSREVFEAEIIEMATQPRPEDALAEMLERYFCDTWMVHNVPGGKCLHINGNPSEGWIGRSFAHTLTVALLGEYDEQIGGGESGWKPPKQRH